ncbi:hypothetical protein OTU49_000575 [Cherax quadricarinatus]|uniref:WH1 domain-containing protein n=1 Tax=Cherax quadricarinatus TaxID=27406 RepID=A0AAW0XXQ8_CHEQU|nr:uncharacterized protein LOC128689084 [Cherax quadricarinatus]XP_053633143.1 uncharacterized protein LOC128689084 [Cherax quadricarinatus]XP_053633144.1 uncharacterized protein LOC128689084 [Cherax quadricarinatus]
MCQGSQECSGRCDKYSSNSHRNSMTMGGVRGGSTLNEVGVARHVPHYASTPHLFVYQAAEDEEEVDLAPKEGKEPIYSSAIDIRKVAASKEAEAIRCINEKYDSLRALTDRREEAEDPLAVTDEDVSRIETFFRGHKTQLWVCRTLANLYIEGGAGATHGTWELKYTGVPILLLDQGETRSRDKRRLQLILAEKGTGFALWRDVVDNLTSYRAQEPQFHTLYLSSDHRRRMGFSFNDGRAACEFHSHIERLTADPANISLSGPGKKKNKAKEKVSKYKAPKKTDISSPCNFQHVTTVDACDKARFFSLQAFSKVKASTPPPVKPHTVVERPADTVETKE